MEAIDTNILIRFIVNDDKSQAEIVRKLFKRTEARHGVLYVPIPVVLEVIWVLSYSYNCDRGAIIKAFQHLLKLSILEFGYADAVYDLIEFGLSTKADLSDILIGAVAKCQGCSTTYTFDKKASKLDLFKKL